MLYTLYYKLLKAVYIFLFKISFMYFTHCHPPLPPPPPTPAAGIHQSVLCICDLEFFIIIFFNSTYKWDHAVFWSFIHIVSNTSISFFVAK